MRTLIFSSFLSFLFCLSAEATTAVNVNKTAVVERPANATVHLEIDARNTQTEIQLWDENKVRVEAYFSYRGDEDQKEKVEQFLKEFEENVIDGILGEGAEIQINTFRSLPSKLKVGWQEFTFLNWSFSPEEVQLYYIIKIPAQARIDLRQSYHPLQIKGEVASLNLEQYSGKLKLDKVRKARLQLKYGEAQIESLQEGRVDLYETDIIGQDWQKVDLNIKYSNFQVQRLGKLQLSSYESEFSIGEVGEISGDLKYSRLECPQIRKGQFSNYESKFYLGNIQELQLNESKYSRYEIKSAERIKIGQSYEDKFSIDRVKAVEAGQSKYGKFDIKDLGRSYSINGYECKVQIQKIGEESGAINIDGKYMKVRLKLDGKVYTLNAVLKYGDLDYPAGEVEANVVEDGSNITARLKSKKQGEEGYKVILNGYETDVQIY